MNALTERLNNFWESVIKKINIDMLDNSISIGLEVIENGNFSRHTITFREVSSYFYLNNIGESRLNIHQVEESDYLELTSINYLKDGIGQIKVDSTTEKWVNQCSASANFVLEIWSKVLFVEAQKIMVDEEEYNIYM